MKHLSSYVLLLLLAVLAACNSRQSQEMEAALEQAKAVYGDGSLEIEIDTVLFIPGLSEAPAYFAKKKQYDKAALAALLNGYSEKDFDKEAAMLSFKEAEHYGELAQDSSTQARAEYQMGKMFLNDGREQDVFEILNKAELFCPRFEEKALIENLVGVCYMLMEDYWGAETYLKQSLLNAEKGGSNIVRRKVLNNFAVLFRIQCKYDQALDCIKVTLSDTCLDNVEKTLAYLNLGNTFLAEGSLDSAVYYYQILGKTIPDVPLKSTTNVTIYDALLRFAKIQGNDSLALIYYEKHESALYELMNQRQEQVVYRIQKQYDYEALQNAMNQKLARNQRIIAMVSVLLTLVLIAFTISQVLLARKRKQEMEAKERILYYVRQYYNLLEKQGKTMQQLAIVMDNKDDKVLLENLRATVFDKKDPWDALVEVFDTLHPDERERIRQQYPDLSELEKKHIILSYFNVSRQDEALMLKTSVHTIDKIRTSVKKKTQESAEKL